ncbi:hypothetical protein J6590_098670 [Homalodisca vitripennis]|nr:hypothetical protein J6590_098670 [Homalodisca vitripennis]
MDATSITSRSRKHKPSVTPCKSVERAIGQKVLLRSRFEPASLKSVTRSGVTQVHTAGDNVGSCWYISCVTATRVARTPCEAGSSRHIANRQIHQLLTRACTLSGQKHTK